MQEYIELEQQLHLLCQPLAKATANLIPEKEDYSHTNLGFDALTKRILTRWVPLDQSQICLALDVQNGAFKLLDYAFQLIESIEISGKSQSDLEVELLKSLRHLGLLEQGFQVELKYTIEDYSISNKPFKSFDAKILDQWILHRSMANTACQMFLLHLNSHDEVRIWPHHFDTGIYTKIGSDLGIGFGLAVRDALHDMPYYYLTGYANNEAIRMDSLPALDFGSWHVEEWKGAALPLNEVDGKPIGEQWQILTDFISTTCNWYLSNMKHL